MSADKNIFYIQQDSCSMRLPPAPASDECSISRKESTTVQRAAYVPELRILEGDSSKRLRFARSLLGCINCLLCGTNRRCISCTSI